MECPKKDLLLDYCAHALDAKAADGVEAHLAACPNCKAWTETHMRTWTLLDEWEAPPISPDFERKLRERIALELPVPWWKAAWESFAARPLKPALSAALVALLLLGAFLFVRPRHSPPIHPGGPEAMDADHLEKALDDVDMLRRVGATGEKQNPEAM